MVMLWTASAYLLRNHKFHWISTVPAMFMTLVCATFIIHAPIGLGVNYDLSVWLGFGVTLAVTALFFIFVKPFSKEEIETA